MINKILNIILVITLIILGFYYYLGLPNPTYTVMSNSMEPTIYKDDLIIVKDVDFNNLAEKDIILYYNPISKKNIVHRIENKNENYIKTKGDNNLNIDNIIIKKENIIGKVIVII